MVVVTSDNYYWQRQDFQNNQQIRATSHTSQELRSWNCENPNFHEFYGHVRDRMLNQQNTQLISKEWTGLTWARRMYYRNGLFLLAISKNSALVLFSLAMNLWILFPNLLWDRNTYYEPKIGVHMCFRINDHMYSRLKVITVIKNIKRGLGMKLDLELS